MWEVLCIANILMMYLCYLYITTTNAYLGIIRYRHNVQVIWPWLHYDAFLSSMNTNNVYINVFLAENGYKKSKYTYFTLVICSSLTSTIKHDGIETVHKQ